MIPEDVLMKVRQYNFMAMTANDLYVFGRVVQEIWDGVMKHIDAAMEHDLKFAGRITAMKRHALSTWVDAYEKFPLSAMGAGPSSSSASPDTTVKAPPPYAVTKARRLLADAAAYVEADKNEREPF